MSAPADVHMAVVLLPGGAAGRETPAICYAWASPISIAMSVSQRLLDGIPEILRRWEAAVRASVPAARQEGRLVLLNNIPKFLQEMAQALGGHADDGNDDRRAASREHASQRAEMTSFSLEQVLQEYGILQQTILDVLEASGPIPPGDLRILLQTVQLGIAEAGSHFVRMQAGALLESEERNRSMVATVVDGIITIDEKSTIVTFNPAAERLFGYRQSEVVGQHIRMLMPSPYAEEHDQYVANYMRTGIPRIIGKGREVVGLRKDGSRFPLDLSVSEYRTSKGRFFTGVVRDITDRKRLEEELQERARQLEEQNRRKDEFLAMLGHELRNPLAAIRSSAELLRLRGIDDPLIGRTQGVISRQVTYLVRLVDDLLDVGRLNRGRLRLKLEPGDAKTMVRQAVEATKAYFEGREQHLVVHLPEETLPVLADSARVTQAVANLLHNASKFTRGAERVKVEARRVDDVVEISVEDEGAGIPPRLLPDIFDLYDKGPRWDGGVQGGLGIGLKLVKHLVEMHGGRVIADSEGVGKGSRFLISLPRQEVEVERHHPSDDSAMPAAGRVLVVDDNVDAASSLAEVLRMQGHQVHVAHTGASAIDVSRRWRPDVVLLDIGLPGMDGYEVARRMKTMPELKGTALIALTGYGQPQDVEKAMAAGFAEHCTKPVDFIVLRRLLAGSAQVPPSTS